MRKSPDIKIGLVTTQPDVREATDVLAEARAELLDFVCGDPNPVAVLTKMVENFMAQCLDDTSELSNLAEELRRKVGLETAWGHQERLTWFDGLHNRVTLYQRAERARNRLITDHVDRIVQVK